MNLAEWHWPQITYAILLISGVVISFTRHGDPRTGRHNVLVDLVSLAAQVWIMTAGGFFK